MRKTTIFRFSSAVAAAGLMASAAALRAQQPEPGQQLPQVHVVVDGETLWDIAERYFGDPFLWPEIYRLNTMVVENPHWIFPGEELRLTPPEPRMISAEPTDVDTTQAQEIAPPEVTVEEPPPMPVAPPPPPSETAPTIFDRRPGGTAVVAAATSAVYRYRPVRRGEFYAAGFLTEDDNFPWAHVLSAVGRPTLRNLPGSSSARIFGQIDIEAPESATYQVGDSLLVVELTREVRGWGYVALPTGIVRVSSVAGARLRADVTMQFGRVADGQVALPIETFDDPGYVTPVPLENGVMGRIVAPRDIHTVAIQQDIVFIDLGREDGVSIGDLFEVLRDEGEAMGPESPPSSVALLQIVHVRDKSASGFVLNIRDVGIAQGAPVRLIRKMPS
ncbi:MAG: LysM peptidoglycan-binding domain-containing protein [Gemmatimonadales bacterium]